MEYLDTTMGTRPTKICKSWKEVLQEVGVSNVVGETYVKQLLRLSQTLAERRKGEQIVVLVDEIRYQTMMDKLGDESFPDSLRLILVLNPTMTADKPPLTLPPSFLHVTLTIPYLSLDYCHHLPRPLHGKV